MRSFPGEGETGKRGGHFDPAMSSSILVSDFDGTVTRRDFYSCVVEELLEPADLQPWHDYVAGEISHFEALRRIFLRIPDGEEEVAEKILPRMEIDPDLGESVARLKDAGWEVIVVSNGCGWYIKRLLDERGIDLPVHTNPGHFEPGKGLVMELPRDSPFFELETGVSKLAVVEDALSRGARVAFAGDGRPDLEPALKVEPAFRFAREWLAEALEGKGESFHSIDRWSDIAEHLLTS